MSKTRALLTLLILSLATGTGSALSTAPLDEIRSMGSDIRGLQITRVGEVVILRGTTEDPAAIGAIEQRLRELGYDRIVNAVELERTPSDDLIRSSIERELYLTPALESSSIRVTTDDGTVTLEGSCSSPAQIAQADRIARSVRGVREVRVNLSVRPN